MRTNSPIVLRKPYRGGVNLSIVFYYGKKYGADKALFFENTDIFVFPTYYPNECFPLVLLEAMEYAIPCISTNEGGISDIIEDNRSGCLVPRNDADMLAEKIAFLIDHPEERYAMGRAGREKFKQGFTLSSFEHRIVDVFNDCVHPQATC